MPEADWQCIPLYRKTQTWTETQFKGQFTFGGEYALLQKQAIEYADKNHIQANYIVLKVPEQKSINDIYLNPTEDALIYYYHCKNPPALSNKIF